MRIKAKILWALLGMCLLVALVGGRAISCQRAVGIHEATGEAEEDARVLAFIVASDHDPAHALSEKIARYIFATGRDVEVVDTHKRIIVDAIPAEVGKPADQTADALDQTLRDGGVRTYSEKGSGQSPGTMQIVVPVTTESGKVLGAVTEEYTPIYNEFMAITEATTRQVVFASLAGVVLAVLLSLYMGASIARPLRLLTTAAAGFAAGKTGLPMPPPRHDEIGDLTVAFDIMVQKRQQAEEQVRQLAEDLKHERERFEAILNSLPAVIFENLQSRNGNRSFVSAYVEPVFGYTPQEWFSTPDFWSGRIHPDDREAVLKSISELYASGNSDGGKSEYRWLTRDNRVIWAETYFTVIRNPGDGATGVRGFTLDITEKKNAEEALAKLHEQLIDASRQSGMAEVATSVLHNVGNVLNSVNICATVASEHIRKSSIPHLARAAALLRENAANLGAYLATDPVGQKLPDFLAQLAGQLDSEQLAVLKELEQLVKNVEHIKDIVSVQQSYATAAGMHQMTAIVDLVEDSVRMNSGALMRHEVQLVREYEARPTIDVDKHKVMQILVNLIRNAKYACDESSRLDKRLTLRVTSDERVVRIYVIDNGVGIPAENLTRIFSHGFTTREDGHGFGLHSAALFAREIGGSLLVQSDGPGRGATFTLELPFAPSQPSHDS